MGRGKKKNRQGKGEETTPEARKRWEKVEEFLSFAEHISAGVLGRRLSPEYDGRLVGLLQQQLPVPSLDELYHQLCVAREVRRHQQAFLRVSERNFGFEEGVKLLAGAINAAATNESKKEKLDNFYASVLEQFDSGMFDKNLLITTVSWNLGPQIFQSVCNVEKKVAHFERQKKFSFYTFLALNSLRMRLCQLYWHLKRNGEDPPGAHRAKCACLLDGSLRHKMEGPEDFVALLLIWAVPGYLFPNEAGQCLRAGEFAFIVQDVGPRGHDHFCANPECSKCFQKKAPEMEMKVCRLCKKEKLRVRHFYCSEDCHVTHWPLHRQLHLFFRRQ